jgi:hypothetical protein
MKLSWHISGFPPARESRSNRRDRVEEELLAEFRIEAYKKLLQ